MDRSNYWTIGLISFATLLFELLQTRLLSFVFWNHLVYLTLSTALLGFGISGTLCAVFKEKFIPRRKALSWLLSAFGLSSIFSLLVLGAMPYFVSVPEPVKILTCYMLFVLPFTCSGAAINLLLSAKRSSVGRLYAVDLLAAGVACMLLSTILYQFGPLLIISFIGVLSGASAFLWAKKNDRSNQVFALSCGLISALFAAFALQVNPNFPLYFSEYYKEIGHSLSCTDAKDEHSRWTAICRIDVIGSPTAPIFPDSVMVDEHKKPDSYKIILQDGTAYTALYSKEAGEAIMKTIRETKSLPAVWVGCAGYWIKKNPEVGIVGLGGGRDVIYALGYNSKSIVAAELNPATFNYVTNTYADYTGNRLKDPRITVMNEEGRAMFRHIDKRLDLINIPGVDTFAATSAGAYVCSENFLYTTQSIEEMMSKLKDDGVLVIHRGTPVPPTEPLRLAGMACEAYRHVGVTDFDKRIVVLSGGRNWVVLMLKKSAFTPEELNTILDRIHDQPEETMLFFPKVLPPAEEAKLKADHLKSRAPLYTELSKHYTDLIEAYEKHDEATFFKNYPFHITPVFDENPFFFECDPTDWLSAPTTYLRGAARRTLFIVMMESLVLSAVAIIWPLLRYRRDGIAVPDAKKYAVYFGCLGLGFMLLEISLVQKSMLLLADPLSALATVLATLLVGAGSGAYLQSILGWTIKKIAVVFYVVLMVLLISLAFGLNPLIYACLNQPLEIRKLIDIVILFPCGLCLGTFFPNGLKAIKDIYPQFVPWAWGINGSMSVLGSFAAISISMTLGLTASLIFGAVIYTIATITILKFADEPKVVHPDH
jgi:spermidine synthase/MFS family permease